MNKVKELGQVMTPIEIVSHMIDLLSLTEEQIKTCSFVVCIFELAFNRSSYDNM